MTFAARESGPAADTPLLSPPGREQMLTPRAPAPSLFLSEAAISLDLCLKPRLTTSSVLD
jgi:hypothetical protein